MKAIFQRLITAFPWVLLVGGPFLWLAASAPLAKPAGVAMVMVAMVWFAAKQVRQEGTPRKRFSTALRWFLLITGPCLWAADHYHKVDWWPNANVCGILILVAAVAWFGIRLIRREEAPITYGLNG